MVTEDREIQEILKTCKTMAVVGCSRYPDKDANRIPKYMKARGYKVIPVNPTALEILGEPAFASLSEITEPVDIVNIFRPSDEVLRVVEEAVKLNPRCIWTQLGIESKEAAELAERHHIAMVMDRCIMVEHSRLVAGPIRA